LPGGNIIVSHCQIARCVCRRAERSVIRLNETEYTPVIVHKFLTDFPIIYLYYREKLA